MHAWIKKVNMQPVSNNSKTRLHFLVIPYRFYLIVCWNIQILQFLTLKLLCYRVVEDNVDLEVQVRIQTKEHKNKSIHWTHQFAEVWRAQNPMIDSTKPQKPVGELQPIELLPSKDIQARFQETWAVLISTVICKYLTSFHQYRLLVVHHIPH